MKKFLKWTGFVAGGLVGIVVMFAAYCYFASEHALARKYTAQPMPALALPTDAASLAEGERLAHLGGCFACHGKKLEGNVPVDIPNVVHFFAPNITKIAPTYSDAELVTLMRQGIKRDGTSAFFMPSEMFRHLRDEDLARILAWVRTLPVAEGPDDHTEVRPLGRLIVATGQFKTAAAEIAATGPDRWTTDFNEPFSRGRYLVMSFCSECHGQDLKGVEAAHSPPLTVAKGYSLEQFTKFMKDGVALGNRQLELMTPTARERFSHFTDEEASAIHAFLMQRT